MLVVSATTKEDKISPKSDRGAQVNISAPGDCIEITTLPRNKYERCVTGTSFAAPHVSGVAGLLLKLNPRLGANEIYDIITKTSDDLGPVGKDEYYGYGRVNAEKAVIYTLFYNPSFFVDTLRLLML